MAHTPDGGPAFPTGEFYDEKQVGVERGMSLRDYFAAKAMDSAIAHELEIRASMIAPHDFRFDAVADSCYVMADAMLRARAKC